MDSRIVGGGTRPSVAYVDDSGRLYSYAVDVPLAHWESHVNGKGFILDLIEYEDASPTMAVTSTGGIMLLLANRSSTDAMVITRLFGTTTQGIHFWMHRFSVDKIAFPDSTLTGSRTLTIKNTNFGVTNPTQVVAEGWDGSTGDGVTGVTLDNSSALAHLYVPAAGVVDITLEDNWIAPSNSTLVVYAKAVSTTANLTLLLAGFLHEAEFQG